MHHQLSLSEIDRSDAVRIAGEIASVDCPASLLSHYIAVNGPASCADITRLYQIFSCACAVGHQKWPRDIRDLVRGKRMLDFGSGTTLYGAVFRALGAAHYAGVDPRVDLRRRTFRSRIAKGNVTVDTDLLAVIETIPEIEYHRTIQAGMARSFDLVVMHTVTEHLLDIHGTFAAISETLAPGGKLWFLHDNFYAWGGHHMQPYSPKRFRPDDPTHRLYADWKHITFTPGPDHPFRTNLNRIRLDDLKAEVSRHFSIEEWTEVEDTKDVVRRLTPEIEASLPGFSRRDLLTRHAICRARLIDK